MTWRDTVPVAVAAMAVFLGTGVAFGHLTVEFLGAYFVGYHLRSPAFFVFLLLLGSTTSFGLAHGIDRFGTRRVVVVGGALVASIVVLTIGTAYLGPAALDAHALRYYGVFWLPVPASGFAALSWLLGRKPRRKPQRRTPLVLVGIGAGVGSLALGVVVYLAKDVAAPVLPDNLRFLLVLLTQTLPITCFAVGPVSYLRDPRGGNAALYFASIALLLVVALTAAFR